MPKFFFLPTQQITWTTITKRLDISIIQENPPGPGGSNKRSLVPTPTPPEAWEGVDS